MRYAARKDKNQASIVAALRKAGCHVEVMHEPVDLLVGLRGVNYCLEVKDKGGTLTTQQRAWHATWGGSVHIVRSIEDAYRAVGLMEPV